jgi:general secretion pathway protein F/type IV pilus assembly protein PilC
VVDLRHTRWACVRVPSSAGLSPRFVDRLVPGVVLKYWVLPQLVSSFLYGSFVVLSPRWEAADVSLFFHNLAVMLGCGLPIDEALAELKEDPVMRSQRRFASNMLVAVRGGSPISSVLQRYRHQLPEAVISLVNVGESSGRLDLALDQAASYLQRSASIGRDVVRAMVYPLLVLISIVGAVIFWMIYVLPDLSQMFRQMGVALPWYTQMALDSVDYLQALGGARVWFTAALFLVGLSLLLRVKVLRGWLLAILRRMPVLGRLEATSLVAGSMEQLATLAKSGVPLSTGLDVLASNYANPFYRSRFLGIREAVVRGETLADSMRSSALYPGLAIRLVALGERTGTLDDQLRMLADEYAARLSRLIETLNELLKPALVMVAGALFMLVVVVFMLPVYQLVSEVMNQ